MSTKIQSCRQPYFIQIRLIINSCSQSISALRQKGPATQAHTSTTVATYMMYTHHIHVSPFSDQRSTVYFLMCCGLLNDSDMLSGRVQWLYYQLYMSRGNVEDGREYSTMSDFLVNMIH